MTNKAGCFGIHGGQYIPETLMNAVIELDRAYNYYKNDAGFNNVLGQALLAKKMVRIWGCSGCEAFMNLCDCL